MNEEEACEMADGTKHRILIDGMSCASCVGRVERSISSLEGVSDVSVNLATESAVFHIDQPSRLSEIVATLADLGYPAQVATTMLTVSDMSCASCVGRVERAIAAVPGVQDVRVNLASETATVSYLNGVATLSDLIAAASASGYPATLVKDVPTRARQEQKADEARALAGRTAIASALTLPIFIVEMGAHFVPGLSDVIDRLIEPETNWVLQFILTSLVLMGPGRDFYVAGVRSLIKLAPDMNSLVAIGTGAAYIYSVVATFLPSLFPAETRAVYFEAASVIVVLILLGRYLEARAKGRTGAAIEKLMKLQPSTACVLKGASQIEVPVENLRAGDIVLVRPGERVPVDGDVVEGESFIDESMITGEPVPVPKGTGNNVTGGSVNGAGALQVEVSRTGGDTLLSQIVRMVEQAQGAKLPIQGLVDRITLWFVPTVMGASALTVLVWLLFGPEPSLTLALVAGVSVLIIACPCAMGLATPTSIMVGTGRGAELGVLFRKGDALQRLSDVDIVAFDKTGTITEGRPVLTDFVPAAGFSKLDVLAIVASVETKSEHPIAEAVVAAARLEKLTLSTSIHFESITGYGIQANVAGEAILVGADRFMQRSGVDLTPLSEVGHNLAIQGTTTFYAAINGEVAAVIGVSDPIKPTSRSVVAALHSQGLQTAMITGDKLETAAAIAAEVNIDHVVAGVLPDGKVDALDKLRSNGGSVAFVGDGINDAPALAQSDVGIAIGTGTDIAIEAGDIVLMSGDLRGVLNALEVSRRTMKNIRENLFWAFAYNAALIPVAAGILYPFAEVLLSPMLAAAAMALSSVFVLANALRLRNLNAVHDGLELIGSHSDQAQSVPAE